MSRKETSNTFTGGLIKDLNPINTPNTVLTDCLNGTLITYDGNEYSLQNEKGNYALKYCKLKPNYIPVGVKEYGDILYIVSYNPLDEHVEIGSYPSPETITDSLDTSGLEKTIPSIWSQLDSAVSTDYSKITEDMEGLEVFYGSNPERCKLNPGDKYKMEVSVENACPYETLEFYAVDENRKTYNITDKLTTNYADFKYIEWDVPGWVAIKPHFASLDDLKVNVRKILVPTYGNTLTLNLNLQALVSDPIFNDINGSDIYVDIKVNIDGVERIYTENLNSKLNVGNDSLIYYCNWAPSSTLSVQSNSVINIEVTPKIKLTYNNTTKYVTYNSLKKSLTFNVGQKGDPSQFRLGSQSWWYRTNSEANTFVLKFDTSGLDSTSILTEDVYLFYSIKRITSSGQVAVKNQSDVDYTKILLEDWNMLGETIIEFPLESFTQTNYTNHPDRFYPEDVYVFSLDFYKDIGGVGLLTGAPSVKKMVVASELLNDFDDACYDKITFDRWMSRYSEAVQNKSFVVDDYTADTSHKVVDKAVTYGGAYELWKAGNNKVSKFSTFVDGRYAKEMEKGFTVSAGVSCPVNLNFRSNIKTPVGPLWQNLLSNSILKYSIEKSGVNEYRKTIDPYIGQCSSSVSANINAKANKVRSYNLQQMDSSGRTIWGYEKSPLNYPGADTYRATFSMDSKSSKNDTEVSVKIEFDSGGIYASRNKYSGKGVRYTWSPENLKSLNNKIGKETSKFDVLFLNIRVAATGSNSWEGAKLYATGGVTGDKDYLKVGLGSGNASYNWRYSTYAPFALFKIDTQPVYVYVNDYSTFYNWASGVDHLICDNSSAISGFFYNADAISTVTDESLKFDIKGVFTPTTFVFAGSDLLSSDRTNISAGIDSNNFKIGENSADSFNSIKPIELETYNGDIYVPTEFGASVDNLLEVASTGISNLNSKIAEQRANLLNDNIYTSGDYTSSTDTYVYKANALRKDVTLLQMLNGDMSVVTKRDLNTYAYGVSNGAGCTVISRWGIDFENFNWS